LFPNTSSFHYYYIFADFKIASIMHVNDQIVKGCLDGGQSVPFVHSGKNGCIYPMTMFCN